jgi:hypothetical protein
METIEQKLARLESENAALKAKENKRTTLSYKVSEKGALSVYGMGRFPVTLYRQQWEKLFAAQGDIVAFIEANGARLTTKE